MRLNGRRESNNIDDRRGRRGGFPLKAGGLGIGGMIIMGILYWVMGGNPLDVVKGNGGSMFGVQESEASASTGPFYCSADEKLYIDLSFFSRMRQTLGADGDFAYAYVIAHEVGHHVQHLLGTLDKAHSAMAGQSEKEANKTSVRIELQADFLAGVWGYHENRLFQSLEEGDLEEAITTASVIGDDYLQKKAQGYVVPDAFNHGRSDQRMRWLKKGLATGDIRQGDTFSGSYSSL